MTFPKLLWFKFFPWLFQVWKWPFQNAMTFPGFPWPYEPWGYITEKRLRTTALRHVSLKGCLPCWPNIPDSSNTALPPHTGWACWPACQRSETGTSRRRGSGRRWSPAAPTAAAGWSWRWCCGWAPGGRSGRPARTQEGALQVQRDNMGHRWSDTRRGSLRDERAAVRPVGFQDKHFKLNFKALQTDFEMHEGAGVRFYHVGFEYF